MKAGVEKTMADVEIGIEGGLGVITLNRPEAINALTREMVEAMSRALSGWKGEARVKAVLLEGRGERGFCAGGDVRAVRAGIVAGRTEAALAFFAAEYALNALIANYEKPVVALTHGVVMGGGIGLAGHAGFRFTTMASRFAMPEGAIGFVPDVGVNFILAKAMPERALHFLMTGEPIGPADAVKLGLTDCVIANDRQAGVRERIVAAASTGDVETSLTGIMHSEIVETEPAAMAALAERLAPAYAQEAAEDMVAVIAEMADTDAEIRGVLRVIDKRCPTSVVAAVDSYRASRSARDIADVLARDLRLARYMAQRTDFHEGVRAVLVDKDHRPTWSPERIEEVDSQAILELVS